MNDDYDYTFYLYSGWPAPCQFYQVIEGDEVTIHPVPYNKKPGAYLGGSRAMGNIFPATTSQILQFISESIDVDIDGVLLASGTIEDVLLPMRENSLPFTFHSYCFYPDFLKVHDVLYVEFELEDLAFEGLVQVQSIQVNDALDIKMQVRLLSTKNQLVLTSKDKFSGVWLFDYPYPHPNIAPDLYNAIRALAQSKLHDK